jgi:hypothetical protein
MSKNKEYQSSKSNRMIKHVLEYLKKVPQREKDAIRRELESEADLAEMKKVPEKSKLFIKSSDTAEIFYNPTVIPFTFTEAQQVWSFPSTGAELSWFTEPELAKPVEAMDVDFGDE